MVLLLLLLVLCLLFFGNRYDSSGRGSCEYLSRNHTCFVNGFFIVYVFVRHFSEYGAQMSSLDAAFLENEGGVMGQLLVSTFLLFSGYGIQMSYQRKGGGYAGELVRKRFLVLLRNFAGAVLIYVAVKSALGVDFSWRAVALSMVGWFSVGNSNWFIFMTLVEYLLIAFCYLAFSRYGRFVPVIATAVMTYGWTCVLCFYKPFYWYNTIMCVPAGMLLAELRGSVCRWQLRMGWRIFLVVIPLMLVGREIHMPAYWWCEGLIHPYIGTCLGTAVANIGAVMFACGLALFAGWLSVAGYEPAKLGRILVWCGGPALFYLYIYQRVPMLVGKHYGLPESHGYAYFITCLVVTVLIAWLALYINGKLQGLRKR